MTEGKPHWEIIYSSKEPHEVSWTQDVPKTSLDFIKSFNLSKEASIIDVGGGDSRFVDFLIDQSYTDITVLDISEKALERTRLRLGDKANGITWIVSDITEFVPDRNYSIWHDRATFHFLTTENQINKYLEIAGKSVSGYIIIGTFSENGPEKCSGLEIKQYSESTISTRFKFAFEKIRCIREDHKTPFNTVQNFLFCGFKKR